MAKIQLTLSTGYVPNWGAYEGIREIIQNQMDAADDGFEGSIRHSGTDVLRVTTERVKLDANVWLLGTSSKGSGKYRGHFGEGLKLGVMALVRAGHDVKIVNDDESWTPKIEPSETFNGADVLTIYTHKRQQPSGKFVVEIGGISAEVWGELKKRFLHLASPSRTITTNYGEVILDKAFQGQVFVKGIFVQSKPGLAAGYNFHNVNTDRDRKMVDDFDFRWAAARAWEEALTRNPDDTKIVKTVIKMLEDNAPDVVNFASGYDGLNEVAAKAIVESFVKDHGVDALPVSSMAESREAEHMGKRGVVVPAPLVRALKSQTGDIDTVRTKFKAGVAKVYNWGDLSDGEKSIYTSAVTLVENAAKSLGHAPVEERLRVVDFNDPGLEGTHSGEGIQLAKKLLGSFEDTLATLVHEVAHDKGKDGEVGHERAEGVLFSRIIAQLKG